MNPTDAAAFAKQVNDLEVRLAKKIIDEIQKGNITEEQGREMSDYILDVMQYVWYPSVIPIFLEQLVKEWPLFAEIEESYKKNTKTSEENDEKISQVRNQFSELLNNIKK